MEIQKTIPEIFQKTVDNYPERPALGYVDDEPITYAQLKDRVMGLCAILEEAGIKKGDRIAILSENCPHWGLAFLAVTSMGAVAVPILTQFHSSAVVHILKHSEARMVFVSKGLFHKIEDADLFESDILFVDDFTHPEADLGGKKRIKNALSTGRKGFDRLKQAAYKYAGWDSLGSVAPDDLATIVYTSGTTGHSKGVMLTHKSLVYDAEMAGKLVDADSSDRFLSILPLAHTYECSLGLLAPVLVGASVYYLQEAPTPRILLPAMGKVRPTIMLMVPLVIEKIFKTKILPQLNKNRLMRGLYGFSAVRKKLHKLAGKKLLESFGGEIKALCIGGAALAPEAERFLRDARVPYSVGYGLTETAPLVAGSRPAETRYTSTGPGLNGLELRIDNPDPETGIGEILVRGPNVMQGYYKAPEITREVMADDGWLKTGDLGKLDRDGYLYIKGRLKNVILGPSGENIYPEEVEAVINQFDHILESLVYSQNNKLVARVHLNYEKLDEEFGLSSIPESQVLSRVKKLLDDLKVQVNSQVSDFSRLSRIIEQTEPFEKTPTQKIKRYLYVESE
ncbi:AMP-binding protein [Desulfonatronovibrio hydrogenovorans]|uniref:AMP-binding protein n=1 Tax=Desulfonatronovibrio hydrogenovorans TaxID=53245 RepID=UPI00048FE189|nr:AMP-binding protein [Desulfonatronovibrio hydrogenovorans]